MFSRGIVFVLVLLAFSASGQDIFDAAREGNVKRIKTLVQMKADTVNAVNDKGFSPLMIACYRGQLKAAKLLVSKGANVNGHSHEGSPLQAASYQNETAIASLLIKNGANLDIQGPDGNTALMYAVLNQNEKLVKELVAAGANLMMKNLDGQTAHSLAMTLPSMTIRLLVETTKPKM